jgi:thiol-disulfide isomerase/thioredoxin
VNPETETTMMKHLRIGAVSLLLAGMMATPCRAQNEESSSTLQDFYPVGDYILESGGALVTGAEFFLAERIPALLISVPDNDSSVLLFPRTNDVKSVMNDKLVRKSESRLDVVEDSVTEHGKLRVLASWIVFSIDEREWILKSKPWLLGIQDVPTMLDSNPEYQWRSKAYTPNKAVVEELKSQSASVKVRAYFGSWCAFCKRYIPLLMKVASQLEGSHVHIEFYGLPRGWGQHPVAGPLKITVVPTGIVYIDGREAGRFTGNKWQNPEQTLKEILQQADGVS